MTSKNLRLKFRVRTLREKLEEYSSRGDMKAICHNLVNAQKKGLLDDKHVLLDTIESVARNFHVSGPKGRRYRSATSKFYEALLIIGGPKIANFVSMNLDGPNLNTIYRWRKLESIEFMAGFDISNFNQYFLLMKGIMEVYQINKVPVMVAEDETAIVGSVQYNQDRDELLGFCGPNTDDPKDHKCLEDFHVMVGDDNDAYDRLVNAFAENKIGKNARVMLINPLHDKLPRLVALLMPTCNRFNHHTGYKQWQQVTKLYQEHLEQLIGPLIGHSSDSDSRRRKLQLQLMMCTAGERFRPIDEHLGFFLSTRKEINPDSLSYTIREVGDQDVVHNHKKMINHLDHTSRMLYIEPTSLILMNHLELVSQRFPTVRHGLTRNHLRRDRDRQNWKVAQELSFLEVQNCLQEIIDGHDDEAPDPSVQGTKEFLSIVHHYVEIFFSPSATLTKRIENAGFVTHILGIWRNFTFLHQDLKLTTNFLSRETYSDILISTHFAVILICYFRDNFPQQKCLLNRTGSDCCEEFFSKNGQFVGNHHVYTYGQMFRNVGHMIRLNQIEADDNAPCFAKAHIKQENVWRHQFQQVVECSLIDYPLPGEEISAWTIGMEKARELAKHLGMLPGFFQGNDRNERLDDPDDPDQQWFYSPFTCCDHVKLFRNLSGDNLEQDHEPQADHDTDYGDGGSEECVMSNDAPAHTDDFLPEPHEAIDLQEHLGRAVDVCEVEWSLEESDRTQETNRSRKKYGTIVVPGHGLQHISTLVKLLNENPNMSKDRLVRVRQTSYHDHDNTENSNNSGISLFEDVAYLVEEDANFGIGRIQRMQRQFQNPKRTIDYKDTIPYNCGYLNEVTITLSAYAKLDENTYKLNGTNIIQAKASNILSHVNLTFEEDKFTLNSDEKITITEALSNMCEKSTDKRVRRTTAGRNVNQNEDFDGRFSVIVTPQEQSENGRRTSSFCVIM